MRASIPSICLAAALLAAPALAQTSPVTGVEFGASETQAGAAITAACGTVTRIDVPETRFPFAAISEVHLRCQSLSLADGASMTGAVFTFADDTLVLIEVRGDAAAMAPEADPVGQLGDFEVFMPAQIMLNRPAGRAWAFQSMDVLVLALGWENPAWTEDRPAAADWSFEIPAEIVFGAELEVVEASLQDRCTLLSVETIDEAWLPTAPAVQRQINCYGYEIAGYPRKLEFVFGDDRLEQMWLLFGPADIDRLREVLTARFGAAIHVDDTYEVFDDWRIALRKDKSEILMGSDALAAIWGRDGL
tara:strand:+ start:4443 stop:5354 length:912 start_codon:yes stop_codon:yes gene_type:complete